MIKRACFPGSFDPFTKGHEDIVRRAIGLFDEIIISIGTNTSKQPYFDLDARKVHINNLFKDNPTILVKTYSGLTTHFIEYEQCTHLLRGLRDVKDFNYEMPIALLNRQMSGIETIFILPDTQYIAINSTIIREIHKSGGEIASFVTNSQELVLA